MISCKPYVICLFLVLGWAQQLSAQRVSGTSTLQINDQLDERIFAINQLEFYEDNDNRLSFREVSHPDFQQNFKIRPKFTKKHFNTDYTYWVKLSIQKSPESKKKWMLEFYDQTIDQIEVYAPLPDGEYKRIEMGDAHNFSIRNYPHKNFELVLENESAGMSNYYIKIQSSQKADIRIAIRSLNRFVYYALNEYFAYGIFYGMVLIIALYNILVFFAVKEGKYLYYTLYLLSVGIYAMCVDGIAFQYLWPNSPRWNQIAFGVFSYMIIVWAILFSMRFLNSRHRAPKLHCLLWLVFGLKTLVFTIGITVNKKLLEIHYYDIIPFFIIFFASIYIWTKGYQVVRFFVIAYGVLFIGMGIKILTHTALIPHYTLAYYSLHLGFLIEMLLLTFALADRIRILKRNKDLALLRSLEQMKINNSLKEKVNQELEQKVHERTLELEDQNRLLDSYNAQLQEKNEEIKRINALLDRDNWKLKSSIKRSFHDRLDNNKLSYQEFIEIFPEASACCRYLEELKWGKGYTCNACGNKKSINKGPKVFTKRCSKCGYIESVTASTVFHGIRFPLEKAFYIAYTVISGQALTLNQLSDRLDMRKNTVWSFRKKTIHILEQKGTGTLEWKDIIFTDNKA